MSLHPSAPQPIPSRRRSPSVARSTDSRFSRDGSDSSHSQGWPSWHHQSSRSGSCSSGRQGSDLIFAMDPEPTSNASSSRHGSAEPSFMYGVPGRSHRPTPDPPRMPVCSHCGRQFYADAPMYNRDRSRRREPFALCSSCGLQESRQPPLSRSPEDSFYSSDRRLERRPPVQQHTTYQSQQQPSRRNGRQLVPNSSTHFIGRPFPSYGGLAPPPLVHSISEPYQPSGPWTDVCQPLATFAAGSHRPRYQLPQLITQLQTRPTPDVSPTRAEDPYGLPLSSPYVGHRRRH